MKKHHQTHFSNCLAFAKPHSRALAVDQLRLLKVQRHTGIACGSAELTLLLLNIGLLVLELSELHIRILETLQVL